MRVSPSLMQLIGDNRLVGDVPTGMFRPFVLAASALDGVHHPGVHATVRLSKRHTAFRAWQFQLRILPLLFGMPTWENTTIIDRNTRWLEAVSLSFAPLPPNVQPPSSLVGSSGLAVRCHGGNHQRQGSTVHFPPVVGTLFSLLSMPHLPTTAYTATAIPFIYSFSGKSAASAPISTFMCL
jgi:hypothetical protein